MRITMLTIGTRGDVQPCIAFGMGLRNAGHDVCIATHAIFEPFIRAYGLDFAPIEGNPREILEGADGQAWLATGRNPLAMMSYMRKMAIPFVHKIMQDALEACRGSDVVIFSVLGFFAAYSVVEKLKIPALGMYLQPVNPTRDFPNILFPPLPGWMPVNHFYNHLTYEMGMELNWRLLREALNMGRADVLSLPPLETPFRKLIRQPFPILYAYSPSVVPKPRDWGEHLQVTGYCFLDDDRWQPPADLVDFLESGTPPVYIGFGSMAHEAAEETAELVLGALAKSGQRGLLVTGWGGIQTSDLPESVFKIESAPHDWLFPRMAAVAHHGGAGTTAAGLRAGIPSMIVPHFADQPFWARRVQQLGVGTKPIPRKLLTAEKLAHAIQIAVTDPSMRRRAADLGACIRAEDGVGNAVRAFEQIMTEKLLLVPA